MALPRPEELFAGPPKSAREAVGRLTNIFASGEQVDLVDAVLADISDAIPFVGDLFSGVRTAQLISAPNVKNREQKATLMAIDTIVGIVPVVGDAIDLLLPANTINFLVDRGALPAPPEMPFPRVPSPQEFAARARAMLPGGR